MSTLRTIPDEDELVAALKSRARQGGNTSDDRTKVGSEVWDAVNGRRIDLIDKHFAGKLDDSEREELEELDRVCGNALAKAFPLLPADLDGLIRLRDQLRAEKAGHGE